MNAQQDLPSPPSRERVVGMVGRARAGDEAAFQWLQDQFHLPLVGVVAEKTRWEHHHARAAVEQVWRTERDAIVRLPEDGGYGATNRGTFHYFIWNHCISWAKHYERNTLDGPLPGQEAIRLHPVTIERKRTREVPLEHDDVRQRDVRAEPEFESDDGSGRSVAVRAQCEAMFVLFETLFLPAIGYPHQQLSFGFSKLIYGRESQGGGMYGDPTQTVERHATAQLTALSSGFAQAYAELVALTPTDHARIQAALAPLRARLPATVAAMVRGDLESERQCAGFAEQSVGETRLDDYFVAWGGDGVTAITNWSNRVKERVKRWLRIHGPRPGGAGSEAGK